MKKTFLLAAALVVAVFALGQAVPLSKVSPAQGNSAADPILGSPGSSSTVKIKATGPSGTTIDASSDNPSAISISPASPATGSDSTATFTVSFASATTTQAADAVLAFGSGSDSLKVYARRLSSVPSLTTYGLIALALLLAGTAVWMFRRRRVSVA